MKHYKNYIVVGISLVITAFVAYTIWLISKPIPLEIQGEVEATHVKVASKLVGRVDSLPIIKGQNVTAGDVLFRIESPELDAKMAQAKAVEKAAQAQNSKALNGARSEDIQAAFNTWKKAEAAANLAKKTFTRISNLYNDGVIAEQKRDEAETQMLAAVETEKAAHAIYTKALNGAQAEDKAAAGALVEQARGVISEVNAYLNETYIKAPINGEVANIIAERGELVPAGYPVVTIVDLSDVWVTFNMREDLLAQIQKGTRFKASIPALGNKEVELEVSYINALGDYATWNATKTSGDFDLKTFEVQARPVSPVEGLRPGYSVLVNWNTAFVK